MPSKSTVYLLFFLLRHRIKYCDATAFHDVEAQAHADEIEILHDLVATVDALANNAGEGLPEEARAVEDEADPVEEYLHDAGDLERVVRGCEDDSVRRHDLLEERVPVVLQGTELLTLLEALLAAPADPEPIIAQGDDLVLDVTKQLQVVQEPADGVIGALLAGTSSERGYSLLGRPP